MPKMPLHPGAFDGGFWVAQEVARTLSDYTFIRDGHSALDQASDEDSGRVAGCQQSEATLGKEFAAVELTLRMLSGVMPHLVPLQSAV